MYDDPNTILKWNVIIFGIPIIIMCAIFFAPFKIMSWWLDEE